MKDFDTPTKIIDLDIQKIGKTSLVLTVVLSCVTFAINKYCASRFCI